MGFRKSSTLSILFLAFVVVHIESVTTNPSPQMKPIANVKPHETTSFFGVNQTSKLIPTSNIRATLIINRPSTNVNSNYPKTSSVEISSPETISSTPTIKPTRKSNLYSKDPTPKPIIPTTIVTPTLVAIPTSLTTPTSPIMKPSPVTMPNSEYPRPEIDPTPTITPTPPAGGPTTCSLDDIKLGVCLDLLGGLINVKVGYSAANHPCCPLIQGLVDLEASVCICTLVKGNILGIIPLDIPLHLLLNTCGMQTPFGFQCP